MHDPARKIVIALDPELGDVLTRYSKHISSVSLYRNDCLLRKLDSGASVPTPFYSFDSTRYCRALVHAVLRSRSVESMLRTEVIAISPADGLLRIRGARYDQITAGYVVVADGAASRLRSALSVPFRVKRYHEAFLVSNSFTSSGQSECEIYAHRNGTAVFLPVGDNLAQWFVQIDDRIGIPERKVSARYAKRLGSETDTLDQEVRVRTGRLGKNDTLDSVDLVRVQSARADSMKVGRAFIVGDAAYRIPAMSSVDFDHLCFDISLVVHSITTGECVDEKRQTLLADSLGNGSRISRRVIGKGWQGLYRAVRFGRLACLVPSSTRYKYREEKY